MMDKKQIKDVIEEWRNRNIRENSIWRNPRKAKDVGEAGWLLFGFTAIVAIIALAGSNSLEEFTTDYDALKFRDIAIQNMDCTELKDISLIVESENFRWQATRDKITAQLLARC